MVRAASWRRASGAGHLVIASYGAYDTFARKQISKDNIFALYRVQNIGLAYI